MTLAEQIIDAQIRAVQEKLGLEADGDAGPKTWAAIHKDIVGEKKEPPMDDKKADARSEKKIMTLLEPVRPRARAFLAECARQGFTMIVTSGFRSYAEQKKLYDAYLKGGPKAAPPGNSGHNFGISFDATLFRNGKPVWESPLYKKAGAIGKAIGLSWGGAFGDEPHYSFRPKWAKNLSESAMMKELRRRKEKGIAIFP